MTKEEIWLELLKQKKYSVTDKGEVLNLVTQKKLSTKKSKNPLVAFIYNKKVYTLTKGRAVWIGRFGKPNLGCLVSFKDKDNNNTHPDNLVLITPLDKITEVSMANEGKKNGNTKLCDADVELLRSLVKCGQTVDFNHYAQKFNVNKLALYEAVRGNTFKHLKDAQYNFKPVRPKGYNLPSRKPKPVEIKPVQKIVKNTYAPVEVVEVKTVEKPKIRKPGGLFMRASGNW